MIDKILFDYRKLRGRIIEKFETQGNFAGIIGMTERNLSLKLNNGVSFTQKDIIQWCDILEISTDEIPAYFFTRKV